MTDIIFSFDTEDFTSNKGADAILTEAEILRKHGVRGCFCLVGLLAKQLVSWGRTDVLGALKYHEIDNHTYGHTLHPMINEYTDTEDFHEAKDEVIRQETESLRLIKEATGAEKIYASVPPGNSKSYAAMYAYSDMGIPIYADTYCDPEDGGGSYYCNIFHIAYAYCMEQDFFTGGEKELKAVLDRLAQRKRAVVYTHPQISLFSEWWDIVNYDKENLCEFGEWKECRRRPQEQSDRFYKNLDLFITLLKNDGRFRVVTYSDVAYELKKEAPRIITRAQLPEIRKQLAEKLFPVTEPDSYSLSDIFLACRDFLTGKDGHICGKVYGFLSQPYAADESFILTAEEIKKSAENIKDDSFLPEKITVGGKIIGPADWLLAALDILCGEKEAVINPKAQLPCLDVLSEVRDCSFKGTWRHSDRFEDRYLSDRLRYQSWTMRFPKQFK